MGFPALACTGGVGLQGRARGTRVFGVSGLCAVVEGVGVGRVFTRLGGRAVRWDGSEGAGCTCGGIRNSLAPLDSPNAAGPPSGRVALPNISPALATVPWGPVAGSLPLGTQTTRAPTAACATRHR